MFCSFNNSYKITPDIFEIWMRLLRSVEGSVLWLFEANDEMVANLRREAESRGIDADNSFSLLAFPSRTPGTATFGRTISRYDALQCRSYWRGRTLERPTRY